MDWKEFVSRIEAGTGGVTDDDVRAVLIYLAQYVPAIDARPMASSLPDEAASLLLQDTQLLKTRAPLSPPPSLLDDHSEGHALEIFGTTCRVLDELLGEEGRVHFRRNLSPDIVATFGRAPAERAAPTGTGHELADGRPGSNQPLSEGNPAQHDSVARDEDPHGSTKLSGASGTTQERQRRTLAEGEPGSTRPLSKHEP